jgi:type II secretory pathway pseudopilin PulG
VKLKHNAPAARSGGLAFTLIELLLVVGIIALLAAMAIPHVLEAQTRAKVARVKAEFAGISTAIEAYWVDYGALPPYAFLHTGASGSASPEIRELRAFKPLTTPLSYVSGGITAFLDPFMQGRTVYYGVGYAIGLPLLPVDPGRPYYQLAFGSPLGAGEGMVHRNSGFQLDPHSVRRVGYFMTSVGPDGLHDTSISLWGATDPPEWQHSTATGRPEAFYLYDPSNGTTSVGDLMRVGGEAPEWFKREGWPRVP